MLHLKTYLTCIVQLYWNYQYTVVLLSTYNDTCNIKYFALTATYIINLLQYNETE